MKAPKEALPLRCARSGCAGATGYLRFFQKRKHLPRPLAGAA